MTHIFQRGHTYFIKATPPYVLIGANYFQTTTMSGAYFSEDMAEKPNIPRET